ncbi:uncharacterized protein LOC143076705 [Mytilus galloprovincialis]|uniref:uncharacterized protein LOC143076705 n=1 Tax=Mytilus galloprovincialis TaxID=29158 RepID=UPI003F7C6486
MSDHQYDVAFDDREGDQDYQNEEMFSQSAQKEQDLESDIGKLDMIEEEIKRKNERIIELELMLEEKQDWFNLKTQMVKKLEGELNYVHARHPERFTFDDAGTSLVPKSLEQTLKDLEREEREETFRTKYMPVYHRETEVFRKRGKYPTNVPYFNEVSMASEFLKKKYLESFGECFCLDYKKKSFPVKPDPSPHTHLRPSQSTFIQQEGNRKFLVSGHLGEVELLPAITEACDLERFSTIPANQSLTGLDDLKVTYSIENLTRTKNSQYDEDCGWKYMTSINIAYELKLEKQVNFDENQLRKKCGDTPIKSGIMTNKSVGKNWWQGGESFDMWRTRPKLGRPTSPSPFNDKNQADHANVVELINGNNQFNTVSGTAKQLLTETLKDHGLKKSLSMESVFEGDGTKMRPNFIWRMGDECVSLEKYIHVYTRNPEELYEAVKKRAIEKEEEEDYEENVLYAEEIKASLIGIDKTKIKSNLRILDNFIREEEEKEKAKSTLKQVNTENADEAIYGTLNEKNRADEEKIVLQPDQTGSCYENTDGSNEVGYEKKMNTTFEIIEEIKASLKGFDKNKIKSNLRILDNLIREEEEKAKSELKQVHTENTDQAAVDVTRNDKIRDTEEKIVLPPDQTGSCYEDTDGTNEVGYEKKMNTTFEIIEEIKASLKGFDKNKIKSNLRILDNLIREEEEKEKAKSELEQVHTENTNQAAVDVTGNDKIRDTKEKIVLPPDQIGSCYEDTDGTNEVGYEKEINTCFDIFFEKPKKRMSKPKLSSEKRKPANLMPNVIDQNIKRNENKEDVKLEEKKMTCFDIMFEKPKKHTSKPKLSSEKRKTFNLMPNVTDQNIKSSENIEDVKLEEKKVYTSFEIMFDNPKKKSTKPKLTSAGRKAKFQLKYSIDEKKDKSVDNEQNEDATTADSHIVVENIDDTCKYKEEQEMKKNVSFDVFFENPKKLKPKPKLTSTNRKQENETKYNVGDNEVQKEENHEKSHIEHSKTTEVNLSNGGKLGGKFTNDVLIKRKDNNENGFRFSFLHYTTTSPSRIPVMVRSNGQNTPLTRLNNERPQLNSVRRIPFSVLKVTNTYKANITGPLAVRSTLESKMSVRRGTDLKINSTRNAKSPNDDSGLPRKRERGTKLPRITRARKSRIPVRIKDFVWNTYKYDDKLKIDESRRLLTPLSRIPIPKDKIRRLRDCNIPRLDPNEHLPQIFHSYSKGEEQAKIHEAKRNLVPSNPMTIVEKGGRTCPGSTSEFLQLPSTTTQNAMVKTSYPVSTSGLTRHTQINGRKESVNENRIVSSSVMGTLPPIVGKNDTQINRPLSASGFAKLPPIKSTNKTIEMDRPMSSVRLSPMFAAFEKTANRPLSARGSPSLPPMIDGNTFEMCRPTSSLSGYTLIPPIPSYKRGSVEDENVPVEESNR